MVAQPGFAPTQWQASAGRENYSYKPAVIMTPDLRRVAALPRRAPIEAGTPAAQAVIAYARHRYGRDRMGMRCACADIPKRNGRPAQPCILELKYSQAWALAEIELIGGVIASMGVGHGKSALGILAPLAFSGCQTAVVLCQPNDVPQYIFQYEMLREHWRVPEIVVHSDTDYHGTGIDGRDAPKLHLIPYSRIQTPKAAILLRGLAPDVIIADECDKLRDPKTATVARFLRCFEAKPETRFAGWTGTLTDASLEEYWHLCALALRERSPLPLDINVVKEWGTAIDPIDVPADPGALMVFCEPGEHIHSGWHRRFAETPGVVTTKDAAVEVELTITERPAPPLPPVVMSALESVRRYVRPDGEELVEITEAHACARQVAMGFYYRWIFPHGEPDSVIDAWFAARKAWNRAMRLMLQKPQEHLDSPKLLEQAAMRYWGDMAPDDLLPEWEAEEWPAWRDIRDQVRPESQAVRLHPFLVEDAIAWAREHVGIVWCSDTAFAEWMAEISKMPHYAGGKKSAAMIVQESGTRSIIASRKAHGRGRDGLQRLFKKQLITCPPANATGWEQTMGRLVRTGQEAPHIGTWYYAHTEELAAMVDKAIRRADYVQGTMRSKQKLLAGLK